MRSTKVRGKVMSFAIAGAVLASVIVPSVPVKAVQGIAVTKESGSIQEEQIDAICDEVVKNIEESYAGVYSFDNYEITVHNETDEGDTLSVDIDVLVDMTLIRNPQESPYVIGMKTAVEEITDDAEKEIAQQELDAYLQKVMPYYNVPILTGFLYRVYIPTIAATDSEGAFSFDMYHRMDITDEEVILSRVLEDEQFTEIGNNEDGGNHISKTLLNAMGTQITTISYDASAAVEYAVAHATDEPEYSKANGNGSDCANFVSQCINAGGIPQDRAGNWYQGSTNWIRTGYNKNGGVVPYLTGKEYFAPVASSSSATEGSIMYYNTKSHVAIVTLIDGSTIKYSHHSNVKKDSVYYVYNSSSDNVTFYVPQV